MEMTVKEFNRLIKKARWYQKIYTHREAVFYLIMDGHTKEYAEALLEQAHHHFEGSNYK